MSHYPLHKMTVSHASPVEYHLSLGEETISLNSLLGRRISLHSNGAIFCIQCSRKTNKSFQQGFCFPCYQRLLECGLCVIHPEKCRYYEGVCREEDWAHAHCRVDHVVYLANSSGVKVGITRASQVPTRWIDQGAAQGMVILRCKNRHQAGLLEVALKQHVNDKTNWRVMLQGQVPEEDLLTHHQKLFLTAEAALQTIFARFSDEITVVTQPTPVAIQYPVLQYPKKITSLDFSKTPEITGTLLGIKAQYLILDTGVISIRKFAGYAVTIIVHDN